MASHRRLAALQTVGLAILLAAVAALVYGNHAADGGWVGDAWLTRAWFVFSPGHGFFDEIGHFFELKSMGARPANAVYRVILNEWFGEDTAAWFTWQIASCVLMCLAVYALLRELRIPFFDAAAIATLLLVFPASAAIWLWSPVVHASLAIALGSLGFLLALRGFRTLGWRSFALHAGSLLAFVLSLLLYEVCLPLFLASVLLYVLRAPRRLALRRWFVDCLVLLPIAVFVTSSTEARDQGLGGGIAHGADMAGDLPPLLFGRLLPFGSIRGLACVLLAAVYIAAILIARRLPSESQARQSLRSLLAISLGGLAVVVLGYLIYVPGLDYYRPLARGIGDRVNAVAAIGWTLIVYGLLALIATLCTLELRRAALGARLVTAALVVAVGVSWLAPIADESRAYVAAHDEGERVLGVLRRAVPEPPPGSVVWVFGQPVEAAVGVPIFANYWNMTAAAELTYDNRRVQSFVAFPGTVFACRLDGVVPGGHFEYPAPPPGELGRFGSRYGRTYFVDTIHGQFAKLGSRRDCLRMRDAFARSPQLPPGGGG